ncbi:MAG TPA: sugar ABC transporter ATP-binding protein [Pirellulaceae bacterium]|jgi:rhamnose transport system ATP-binding protein
MPELPLLSLVDISKSFGGVHALRNVSLDVRRGEVHSLVGENGAGKSTLIKIVTGAHAPDCGEVVFDGQGIVHHDPVAARRRGIAVIYQQPALFPDLTVAENIALGLEAFQPLARVDWKRRREMAVELLQRIGANIRPDAVVGDLTMPEQQLVEIAKAIGANARLVIMDEPTASLSERETERLFAVIRALRQADVGVIYISHRLEELYQIADRVTVLRDGAVVFTGELKDVDRAKLIRYMVGRELSAVFPKQVAAIAEPVIELRDVGCRSAGIRNIDLCIRAGEIVALAGLVGAGRTELARVLFGVTLADAGQICLHGKQVRIDSPIRAVELGVAYVPEDRRRHGVILELPVAANVSLAILRQLSNYCRLHFRRERRLAEEMIQRLFVKTPSPGTPVGHLSGGNQQKVAVARWLATKPKLLILDEPTQGIDVGAKAEIHRLMSELAGRGMAILLISSELPEVLGMADRIAVMREGRIAGVLSRAEATQENILSLALGHVAA